MQQLATDKRWLITALRISKRVLFFSLATSLLFMTCHVTCRGFDSEESLREAFTADAIIHDVSLVGIILGSTLLISGTAIGILSLIVWLYSKAFD